VSNARASTTLLCTAVGFITGSTLVWGACRRAGRVPPFGPDDGTRAASYGHGPSRGGAWAEVEYNGVVVRYNAFERDFDLQRPVLAVVRFLSEYGFAHGDDIADA
jgi:hypothetical protein